MELKALTLLLAGILDIVQVDPQQHRVLGQQVITAGVEEGGRAAERGSNFCEPVIDGYTYWVAASGQPGCTGGGCVLANETVTVSVTNGNTEMFQLIIEMPLFNETTLGTTVHCAPTTTPCGLPLQAPSRGPDRARLGHGGAEGEPVARGSKVQAHGDACAALFPVVGWR